MWTRAATPEGAPANIPEEVVAIVRPCISLSVQPSNRVCAVEVIPLVCLLLLKVARSIPRP